MKYFFFSVWTWLSMGIMAMLLTSCKESEQYTSEGERIYRTGRNNDGRPIEAIVDRSSLKDQTMVLTCASCHGVDRKGGRSLIPEFGPYNAPNISRMILTSELPPKRPAYNAETLSQAIIAGIGASGTRLHHPMPRWKMQQTDLNSLVEYLLTSK